MIVSAKEATQMKERNRYTAQEKVAILREHLLDGVSLSQVCEKYRLAPTVLYRWQKQLFENGAVALKRGSDKRSAPCGENHHGKITTIIREIKR